MPVQVFADDSGGKGHSRHFVMAGLIADAENWALFSDEWTACLKESPAIRYFKMTEAAGCSGQFRQWSEGDRDAKLRSLARIINRHARLLTYTVIDLEAHAETWAKQTWKASSEVYFWPFQNTILSACFTLWDLGLREKFEVIFDEQVIFGPRAKAWYPLLREVVRLKEPEVYAIMPVEPMFQSDDDFKPLQAADLFAWLLRNGFDSKERPFPWLLDELPNIIETEYSQHYDKERMAAVTEDSLRLFRNREIPEELLSFPWPRGRAS